MKTFGKQAPARGWQFALSLGVLAVVGLTAQTGLAQPANNDFANAQVITGVWGTATNDLTAATAEFNEPSHAGFPPVTTIWYQWQAPQDGDVSFNTLGVTNDTVVVVYTGSGSPMLGTLRQVAANDDFFPIRQQTTSGRNTYTQPYNGPSALHFNAKAGVIYYIAIGGKSGSGGLVILNWAYNPSGVFRFATEDAVSSFVMNTNGPFPTFQNIVTPIYKTSEWESLATESASTSETYYEFGVPGLLVTVTRLGGSAGRMLVDYMTTTNLGGPPLPNDQIAQEFIDYEPVQGTLIFDNLEMTKRFVIQVQPDFFLAQSNRDFAIILTNARPDVAESPDVAPPQVDGVYGRAVVQILDTDIDPVLNRNFDTNGVFADTTNSVFNISRVSYRTTEDVNGYWGAVDMWIDRSGTNREGATVNYRVNNFLGGGDLADPAEEDNNRFPLQAGSDYATPHPADGEPGANIGIHGTNADFTVQGVSANNYAYPGGGSITWGANDFQSKRISFLITNDTLTEFNEDFHVFLYRNVTIGGTTVPVAPGTVSEANMTILFDDQDPPAGSVDQYHNPDFGANMVPPITTTPPNLGHPGADGVVYGVAVQADNKSIIAGDFVSYNATPSGRIARLNVNGSLDTGFSSGSGANDSINSLAFDANGKILIGGSFGAYNGSPRSRVARLNANGSLDTGFNSGTNAPNNTVWVVLPQPDGKVIVAGEFTALGAFDRSHIARFNTNGTVDVTFDPGVNAVDGTIWSVALQADGKVIIGGEFLTVAGESRAGVARLNPDGTLDPAFSTGSGANGTVYALAIQSGGKVLMGGDFTQVSANTRNHLAQLNADGSLDDTFDPGSSGTDGTIYTLAVVGNNIYVGGRFDNFNGTPRRSCARLYADGTLDTGFLDTAYNQFAGLPRSRFSDAPGIVFATAVQTDGNVMIGGSFTKVGGGQADIQVRPDTADSNLWVEPKARDGVRNRNNIARLVGGATPGPGNIGFTAAAHLANENQSFLSVALTRANGTLGYLNANFELDPGLAQSGVDYIYNAVPPIYLSSWALNFPASQPNSTTRMHSDGLFGDNFIPADIYGHNWFSYTPGILNVTILNDAVTQGDRNTNLRLANPSVADQFFLGGENIPLGGALGRSLAPLTIVDDDHQNGTLTFATANFVVNENVTNAVVTVIRTNGAYGSVSVQYATVNGGTATAGVDYQIRSGTLNFGNGQTSKTFTIPITDDSGVEPDETIFVRLSGVTGGASLGLTDATVTIVDNDLPGGRVNFASPTFSTNESAGAAIITVTRSGSSSGTLTVYAVATNGTAVAGTDFIGVTNLLTWPNNDVSVKTVTVPLIDNVLINPDRTVSLRLLNPTINGVTNLSSLGAVSNATLTIVNDDLPGAVSFSTANYLANENGGPAIITVIRTSGSAEAVSVNFAATAATAVDGVDFNSTNGTLSFGPGELSKSFAVPIINNFSSDGARFVTLSLSSALPSGTLGSPSFAQLTLIDDESVNEPPGGIDTQFVPIGMDAAVLALALQGDGKLIAAGDFTQVNEIPRLRLARLNGLDGSVDGTFQSSVNAAINALALQADGRSLIGGSFTTVNSVVRNRIARVAANGTLDTSFNPGPGADNPVFAVAETFVGGVSKILAGGSFSQINSVARNGIARLNSDGTVDSSFDPGLGANGVVYALAAYGTNTTHAGKVVIVGDFTTVGGVARSRVARLNADGSLDFSFNPGGGANDAVRAVAIQPDGRVLIGGSFTNFNGTALNRIARLNANGAIDPTFTAGAGADDVVSAIVVQGDTRIVLGGQFKHCNGVTRNRVTRLNNNGTVDPTINFGTGANNFVAATVVQPDGKIVIGGGFTDYDGAARARIARIYGGSIAGSGSFEFTTANYQVSESGTNATIDVRRRGGTSGAPGNLTVNVVTSDGTATNGVHYFGGTNTITFPPGEVLKTLTIPVVDDFEINPNRTVGLALSGITPPGAAILGNQPTATLTILNDDSAVAFESPTYAVGESGGVATITVVRTGSTIGTTTVDFTTTTNGTATAGVDFTALTNTITFAPGEISRVVTISILNDTLIEGDETVGMMLTNAIGSLLIGNSQATLTIVDDDFGPGQIAFASVAYNVSEGGTNALISLIRTNGRSGAVSVQYATSDGTATAGLDYPATSGSVSFANGETNQTIIVPITNDSFVEGNETFNVTISNPTGGATIVGGTNAVVTIVDDDVGVSFAAPIYNVSEAGPSVTLTVLRIGGSNGVLSVQYSTATPATNNAATVGADFTGITNAVLTFTNGETFKTLTIGIVNDTLVEGDETFNVVLSNPSSGVQILNGTAVVVILDNDAGLGFAPATYAVAEGGTNVLVTVMRTNVNTGVVSVSYATANGTASAGSDYTAVGGLLTFTNGEAFKVISIPILQDTQVEGDESFSVTLSSPTGGAQLNGATNAAVTIIDDDSGFQFSSANYSISEGGVAATITVIRTGIITNNVSVDYSTADGTATNGQDYVTATGTLNFTNGVTSKTFDITIVDDTVEEPAETVLVKLANPTGQSSLLNPNAATLTIIDNDGSLILPAGTLITAENGTVNGTVDTNETVTVLFALRNVSGTNTTSLVATLLTTNGVTAPSAAQNYGVLVNGGASVSRPFTFTASGTNGGTVDATFTLSNGVASLGRVKFSFMLGSITKMFTNAAPITILDNTNASPYPSTITVAGLGGVVTKVVATVTNLAHGSPDDIDMLLAGPTGANTVLMSDTGGGNLITNVTLTFNDTAVNSLPDSTLIASGEYKPTNFGLADNFPAPAPPSPWGATLASFNGSNPNGAWSLYIMDDLSIFGGSINRGWMLAITTGGLVPAAADLSVKMTGSPDPVIVESNLTYTVVVTNHGPWTATGINLTNTLPAGATYVSSAPSQGTVSTNGAVIWNLGTLAKDAFATATIIIRPGVVGTNSSTSAALAAESDPNPANNVATVTTTVNSATADLGLDVVDAPDPLYIGTNNILTYTIVVSNLGPVTATGVSVTNTLPPGVNFLSATPAGYTLAGGVVTFTNLGNLASGAQTIATITVKPTLAGTLTNMTSCNSLVIDPFKANNTVAVKTIVDFPRLNVAVVGGNFVISWPVEATGYTLESATSVSPPVVWTPVTVPAPLTVGGQKVVTVAIGSGSKYFRLRANP